MGFLNVILSKCVFKGAEETCVEIGTEIKKKKCFRLKDMLNFSIP